MGRGRWDGLIPITSADLIRYKHIYHPSVIEEEHGGQEPWSSTLSQRTWLRKHSPVSWANIIDRRLTLSWLKHQIYCTTLHRLSYNTQSSFHSLALSLCSLTSNSFLVNAEKYRQTFQLVGFYLSSQHFTAGLIINLQFKNSCLLWLFCHNEKYIFFSAL